MKHVLKVRMTLTDIESGTTIVLDAINDELGQFTVQRQVLLKRDGQQQTLRSDSFRLAHYYIFDIWYQLETLAGQKDYSAEGFWTDGTFLSITAAMNDELKEITASNPESCREEEIRRLYRLVQSLAICDPGMLDHWDPRE